jgi:pyruvate/2-oxoglutarate dehydrogenase complex dihydrolipoamide acyltransferase (E2) component
MPRSVDVILERMTANDTSATVVAIFHADGSRVEHGDRIFDVETSKAVYEVCAPVDGILKHSLTVGDNVSLGSRIAQIAREGSDDDLPRGAPKSQTVTPEPPTQSRVEASRGVAAKLPDGRTRPLPRFSRDALALASQYGLTPQDFDVDFVTEEDVKQRRREMQATRPAPGRASTQRLEGRRHSSREPVPPWKQDQIAALQRGAGSSMLSIVGGFLGPEPLVRSDAGFFESKITDLVAYEASRLMVQFRKFNAAYRGGAIEYHNSINAGIAFDGEGRLVVYGIAGSDKLSLPAIQDAIVSGFRKYAQDKLTSRDLVRPTFTITDLSATGVEFVLPLLPEAQSCIIGITRSPDRGYGLYVGFDHRVSEGLEASRFLHELKQRILNHLRPAPL